MSETQTRRRSDPHVQAMERARDREPGVRAAESLSTDEVRSAENEVFDTPAKRWGFVAYLGFAIGLAAVILIAAYAILA